MTTAPEESEKDFKARMILECSKEVIEFKKTEKPTEKQLRDLMKKYEDKIYERFIKKPAVNASANLDVANLDVRHSFTGDASFLTNYNKLLRGYRDETNFNTQKLPYEVKMPSQIGIYQPKNQFPIEHRSYSDTQANSKYYFPQDHDFDQYSVEATGNVYNNKPINDISNMQSRLLAQYMRPGLSDPYNQDVETNLFRNSAAFLASQPNITSSFGTSQQNFAPHELLYQINPQQQQQTPNNIPPNTVSFSPNRQRSPVKYETPALNKPASVYFSPTKREQPPHHEEPVPEPPIIHPEPLGFDQYKKPNFSSSKLQRDEKTAQFNLQYQMLHSFKN